MITSLFWFVVGFESDASLCLLVLFVKVLLVLSLSLVDDGFLVIEDLSSLKLNKLKSKYLQFAVIQSRPAIFIFCD